MKKITNSTSSIIMIFCLLPWQVTLANTDHFPDDVQRFLDNAEECKYFSGEWDSTLPKSRQREIERAVDKYCKPAKKQQNELRHKYKGNQQIADKLSEYDF
ncbi:hypothetical protein [Dickeya dianthicola]|uniref:Uncharacterized protein n=1 Tax=Dickeya dianthicola TaxID=204039 RepID=A0AAX1C7T5_9GAMM|nr:hypothetical protein [Dickeya dianthicola]MCI4002825.1 hypothetical protein [Dickeya dianthicola]MCI4187966.1 hypothetical protein [Dickeya dianthicola]MCI4214764.1 hypothetical protein [Dickeya dianthicola]MCI4232033.1 hypothetical protein [Dickeya dianthicola]MZH97985.1 hypothetical protein [Dickeya dianthicola]